MSRKLFTLVREQLVPRKLVEVFGFFSDAKNLESLTPPWLNFRVLESSTPRIVEGTTIDYRLRLHGLPLRWRSQISTWNPPFEFVDEQLKGPYRSWYHHHSFQETQAGIVVRDRIEYSVLGGALVNRLFVRPDLEKIFDYRKERLASLLTDD